LLYRHYKRLEQRMLECADHVVVLTDRVVPEIRKLAPTMTAPVSVIPCCADFEHFAGTEDSRSATRTELGIETGGVVFSYLGSLGTVYLLDEMLRLFAAVSRQKENLHLMVITQDWREEHEALLANLGLTHLRSKIHVRAASREDVPNLLGASDIMLSFRRSTYSQMACSPTKLAEAFALGIPVISNAGVGDVDSITRDLDAGLAIDIDDPHVFENLACKLDEIRAKGGERLRMRARKRFGLEVADKSYRLVYAALEATP
jgi:glycosyltransferase involved in cell wall biosynthesis